MCCCIAHRLCCSSCQHMRSASANCLILNLARSDSKHCVSIRQSPCKYRLFCFHALKFPAQNLTYAQNTSQLEEGLLLACWLVENTVLQQLGAIRHPSCQLLLQLALAGVGSPPVLLFHTSGHVSCYFSQTEKTRSLAFSHLCAVHTCDSRS